MQIYLTASNLTQQNISHIAMQIYLTWQCKYISHHKANISHKATNISHTAMQIYLTQQCKYISHSNANISHTAMQIYLTQQCKYIKIYT